ncbi:chalcone isomerase family protein [Paraburkholderia humisilvae]|uniref:Chalcone isomerase domain-containing protein n=1 Tax=Paraburkholderia humisilvae TaxID=627669 RepID=A0A6J5CUP6_9BURK|nr:chalcone isomerase family protein [Paraburkholderia humisilvae]CAB3745668.1 hypothetical protein LMG29542_00005 [Paraburkholderia humisilvae]
MTRNQQIVKSIYWNTAGAARFSGGLQRIDSTIPELPRRLSFSAIGRRLVFACGLAVSLCAMFPPSALAAQDCHSEIPAAQLSGAGEFRILGLHLYDAQLWGSRLPVNYNTGFALQLTYTTSATRERLATLGLNEMKRLAPTPLPDSLIARWRNDMLKAFVDVAPGDWLCGVFLPGTGVRFVANGAPTATIEDPEFAKAFFNIWFDPATRAKTLRTKLLGGGS